MLIGAHVSLAGGLPKAIERGTDRGCRAIQIFNQSPRRWQPTSQGEAELGAFRAAMAASSIEAVLVHTVYLLNCASEDPDIRAKSLTSLTHSLRVGEQIGAAGVVLHPGSAKSGEVQGAIARAGSTIREALHESERCSPPPAGGERLGLCLDSCHLFASGYDIRTPAGIDGLLLEVGAKVGLRRIRSLHLNDCEAPLGSNRDRHANVGEGQLGEAGCATFLAAPAFDGLPCVLETPGENRSGASAEEVALAVRLRQRGIAQRRRRRRASATHSASTR